jgi:DNA-binding transcriptional ArsR family regulator
MNDTIMGCDGPDRSPEQLAALRRALVNRQRPLHRLAQHYALLGGETRLKILALLARAGELCVCDLAKILEMTPAAVSQHLSRLRTGRLVESRRDGMTIYYRVSPRAAEADDLPVLDLPRLGEE